MGRFREVKERRRKICKEETVIFDLLHRAVPAKHTDEGLRALSGESPIHPESVQEYLASKFGDAPEDAFYLDWIFWEIGFCSIYLGLDGERTPPENVFPDKGETCYPDYTMKLLFVCTANIDRSPTAEKLFRSEHDTKSCGTAPWTRMKLNRKLIWWADKIFCMEEHHKQAVLEIDPEAEGKVIVLEIEDIYRRGTPELEDMLKEKVGKHL